MKITKRKDGLFQATILNPYTGKREYIYGKTEKDVKDKYKKRQKSLSHEQESAKTLAHCIDKWFEYHKLSGVKYNTIQSYEKPVKDCKEYFGNRKIADILPCDIDDFIQYLISCDYKRQTINLRYIVLCKTFDWAIKNRIILQNSARQTSLPLGLKRGTRTRLTPEQVRKVRESGDIYANMLLYTGTRRCECLAIRWEDIDFESHQIYIHQQVMWENGANPYLAPLKTKNSVGYIPLLKPLEDLLKPICHKTGFIFNRDGNLLTPRQFYVAWDRFVKSINEEGKIEPHMFRHEYVSFLHDAGIDVKSAQALARHSKFETTMNIYTELEENANATLGKVLNNYITEKNPPDSSKITT